MAGTLCVLSIDPGPTDPHHLCIHIEVTHVDTALSAATPQRLIRTPCHRLESRACNGFSGPQVCGHSARSAMSGWHHPISDLFPLPAPGRGAGYLVAADCGLGDGNTLVDRTGVEPSEDGPAATPTVGADPASRPRLSADRLCVSVHLPYDKNHAFEGAPSVAPATKPWREFPGCLGTRAAGPTPLQGCIRLRPRSPQASY